MGEREEGIGRGRRRKKEEEISKALGMELLRIKPLALVLDYDPCWTT